MAYMMNKLAGGLAGKKGDRDKRLYSTGLHTSGLGVQLPCNWIEVALMLRTGGPVCSVQVKFRKLSILWSHIPDICHKAFILKHTSNLETPN